MQLSLFKKLETQCVAEVSDVVEKLDNKSRQRILFCRKQLMTGKQIGEKLKITTMAVNKFLQSYYRKGRDPLQIHVSKSIQLGESIAEISRRLDCHKTEIDKLMAGIEISGMDFITRRVIELREQLWTITKIIRSVTITQSRATMDQ